MKSISHNFLFLILWYPNVLKLNCCIMTKDYHNAQTTVIFVFRIQDKCWNRSEFGVHIKWVELNWNDGGKLCEQSCCCVLNLKGWRNWNIFQLGFRNTECKWWRLGASDSIGCEVGSEALTGNYRSWRSVRNSSSLTSDPHWSGWMDWKKQVHLFIT